MIRSVVGLRVHGVELNLAPFGVLLSKYSAVDKKLNYIGCQCHVKISFYNL